MGVFWDAVCQMREHGRPLKQKTAPKEVAVESVASPKKADKKPKKVAPKKTTEEVKPRLVEAEKAEETAVIANDGESS